MRMRFWATIRKPAFSISALTAPVRLRSVASGLMIEKVRSIAMITSLQNAEWELRGLYRRRPATASDPMPRCGSSLRGFLHAKRQPTFPRLRRLSPDIVLAPRDYNNFTKVNPFCNRRPARVQLGKANLSGNRTLCGPIRHPEPSRERSHHGAIRAETLRR